MTATLTPSAPLPSEEMLERLDVLEALRPVPLAPAVEHAEALASVAESWAGLVDAAELSSLTSDELQRVALAMATTRTAVESAWLRVLHAASEASLHQQSASKDLARHLAPITGERTGSIRRDAQVAAGLAGTPLVGRAVDAGRLSKDKAYELLRASDAPESTLADLVELAETASVPQVRTMVSRFLVATGRVEDKPAEMRSSQTPTGYRVELANLSPVEAETIETAAHLAAERLGIGYDVPPGERHARGLIAACQFFMDHVDDPTVAKNGREHVMAIVPFELLEERLGGSEQVAHLASGRPIAGDVAQMLACHAGVSRIITKGTSEVLDSGRATRRFSTAQARAVVARDRHCTFEGCTAPPWACEIHHDTWWRNGGSTSVANGHLVCRHHHGVIHTNDLRCQADGRYRLPLPEPSGAPPWRPFTDPPV